MTTTLLQQGWRYAALWQLLDQQMHAAFDERQWQSSPDNPWQAWGDEARQQWWIWVAEDNTLSPIDTLRLKLWHQLWQSQSQEGL